MLLLFSLKITSCNTEMYSKEKKAKQTVGLSCSLKSQFSSNLKYMLYEWITGLESKFWFFRSLVHPMSIYPSQECSLWNSLHFYEDLKGSNPKYIENFQNALFYYPFDFAKTSCDLHDKTIELLENHINLHKKLIWISRGLVEACESSEISISRFQSSDPFII